MSIARPSGLRAVLDTTVYFSAFISRSGAPFRVWQKAILGQYSLLVSPVIMRELARVLRDRAGWEDTEVVSQLKLLARVGQIVSPELTVHAVVNDESDNRILECAVAGNASVIVSGDHHLLKVKTFRNIAIVRPVDFVRSLGE